MEAFASKARHLSFFHPLDKTLWPILVEMLQKKEWSRHDAEIKAGQA